MTIRDQDTGNGHRGRVDSNPPADGLGDAARGAVGWATAGLQLRHLGVLSEVARLGSFAAAADALCLTPSAVSQQMAKLERDAGTILFERLPRGTRLTEAGRALLSHAEVVLAALDDAEVELRTLSEGRGGRLRVGSFPTGTATFAAAALETFRARFPDVALHLVDGEPYESVQRLKARELDLAVLFDFDSWPAGVDYDGQPVWAQPELSWVELFDDPFLVVLPRDHPLAALEVLGLSELDGQRVLGSPSRCPPWGADFERACADAGVQPQFEDRYRTVDFRAVQALVATGHGISLIPRLALADLRGDVCARPLEGAPVRHVRVARLVDAFPSAACLAMLEVLDATTADFRAEQAA